MKKKKRPETISWQEIKDMYYTKEEQRALENRVRMQIALRKLKEERLKQDLSQEEFAKKSGLPRSTISKIESGYQNTSIKKIMQFAEALGKEVQISFS